MRARRFPAVARRGAAVATTLATVVAMLAACTATPAGPPGRQVVVPALWVSRTGAGVERATVDARARTDAEFALDLATTQAQDAGPAWQAATAVAATVAVLFSTEDPRPVDLRYTVTGPIDGPSAGAILAIGTLAALRGDRLDPTVTMTGTIASDGGIGPVGGVTEKVRAAAADGFTTVLVPALGPPADGAAAGALAALGDELGVTIRPVADLTEAYPLATGQPLGPAPGASDALAPAAAARTRDLATALVARLDARLAAVAETGPEGLSVDVVAAARTDADAASVALSAEGGSGPVADAYGRAVAALTALVRAEARAEVAARVAAGQTDAVRTELADRAGRQARTARDLLVGGAATAGLGTEQIAALPFALAPAAEAEVALLAVAQGVGAVEDGEALAAVAAEVADRDLTLDVLVPDALAVVRASSAETATSVEAARFLSGYTSFLVRGGASSLRYVETVSGSRPFPWPGNAAQVAGDLEATTATLPADVQGLDSEIVQLAQAVAFFEVGVDLMDRPALGLPPPGVEDVAAVDEPAVLRDAVRRGADTARRWCSALVEEGSGVDAALWASRWGRATLDAASARFAPVVVALGSLGEQRTAVLTCLMIAAGRGVR